MKANKISTLGIIFSVAFLSISLIPFQQPEELKIFQADKIIVVDGNLDEWSAVDEIPVNLSPDGKKISPSSDITVSARFTFDAEKFYAAIKAIDDTFEFPNRSWRYGDGLYLTFVDPNGGEESDRFYSFGFSIQGKKETMVLVNRDGEYFPGTSIEGVQFKVIPDVSQKSINYEIAIPWKYITPFKPFIHERWGINLVYVDRDGGQRKILQLYPDLNYDTELSQRRKGAIFRFINHIPEIHEIQASLNASHYYHDSEKIITCAVNSPFQSSGWKIRYDMSSTKTNVFSVKDISLKKGMNVFRVKVEDEGHSPGSYFLSVGVINDKNSLKYSEDWEYFVINRDEFEEFYLKLIEIKREEPFLKDRVFKESLPTLEIRLEWIKAFMEDSPPFADIQSLSQWYQEVSSLFGRIKEGESSLFPPGQVARLAHRSEIDKTLQPYSVFVPENYNKKTSYPLFVTLHGSGVDERRAAFNMAVVHRIQRRKRRWVNFIILAPKARGLSDWYLGDSGRDVIECINHVMKLYNIDEKNIILDGFSMGGYGAWRLGLLYPDLFRAVIIRSGAVSTPSYLKGEKIIERLDRAKGLNLFIIHGDRDNAVPVENARRAVKRLKELGIRFNYIEVKGATHGGYNKWDNIFVWLRRIMSRY